MMNKIPSENYKSAKIFDAEVKSIFEKIWQPICFTFDVKENNDFFVQKIGKKEILIQNFSGKLKAFLNVCPHRLSVLQIDKCGNRSLQCPYHRLQFNEEGEAINKTLGSSFCYEKMLLKSCDIEICGTLVFARIEAGAQSLKDFLGETFAQIEKITTVVGSEIINKNQDIKANWKIILQNTIEFDHVFSVHPKTFTPLISKPIDLVDKRSSGPHIHYVSKFSEKKNNVHDRFSRLKDKFYVKYYENEFPGYEHISVFPCMTIGHTGYEISFFSYYPVSENETKLNIRVFEPKLLGNMDDNEGVKSVIRTLNEPLGQFVLQLANEDKDICEAVQRGVKTVDDAMEVEFAENEFLVARFHSIYQSFMSNDGAVAQMR